MSKDQVAVLNQIADGKDARLAADIAAWAAHKAKMAALLAASGKRSVAAK